MKTIIVPIVTFFEGVPCYSCICVSYLVVIPILENISLSIDVRNLPPIFVFTFFEKGGLKYKSNSIRDNFVLFGRFLNHLSTDCGFFSCLDCFFFSLLPQPLLKSFYSLFQVLTLLG